MNRHAKASPAGSTSDQGSRAGSSVHGTFATRCASALASGSGALAHRARVAALAVALFAVLALIALAPLATAKVLVNGFGTPQLGPQAYGGQIATFEGQNSSPEGVAVNATGNGAPAGTAYVADAIGGRLERFSPTGAFQRLWGEDVIAPAVNEVQFLNVNATAGTYTLSFKGATTEPIPYDAFSFAIDDALDALPTIGGDANVAVLHGDGNGKVYISFTGALAGADQPLLTVDASQLSGSAEVTPLADGTSSTADTGTGFEICTVATECQAGGGGFGGRKPARVANGGQLNQPQGVAIDQATGDVYVSETINQRISEFGPDGNFIRAWGWDVVRTGGSGDVPGTSEEQEVTINASATGGKFQLRFEGEPTGGTGAGARTSGSNVLTKVSTQGVGGNSLKGGAFAIGQVISGEGIPANTTIVAVNKEKGTLTLSAAATSGANTSTALVGHDIPWDASPAQVQSALEGIPSIGAGNVSVTSANPGGGVVGGPYKVVFRNDLADTDVPQLESSAAGLEASTKSVSVSTLLGGKPGGFEICTAASECKLGVGGANGGQLSDGGALVTDSSGNVWLAEVANRRIQEFDSSGNFIAAYGYNVDKLGGGGELEKCTSTTEGACQAGTEGSLPAQFSSSGPQGIAFDSSGNLYALDTGNQRVQKFNPTLTTASTFGASFFYDTTLHPEGGSVTDTMPTRIAAIDDGTHLAFAIEKVTGFYDPDPGDPKNKLEPTTESQVIELDPSSESVVDTSLVGGGLVQPIKGLTGAGGNIYATVQFGFNLFRVNNADLRLGNPPRQVLVLGDTPPPPPAVAVNAVTTKTDTTAVLRGSVDPEGGLVSCKFQYSTDQSNWTDVPEPGCDSLAQGGGAQAVSQAATGLIPGTHYYVRLQASRPLLVNSTVTSGVASFDTDAVPPVLDETALGAIQVSDTSARLVGSIDPRHSDSGYIFEYGTSPALGSSTSPLAIGDGAEPVSVSQLISGLSKDTTYYFRLRATNVAGTTTGSEKSFHTRAEPFPPANPGSCPNEAVRAEQSSTFLPDCRAYEMVSPPDKNQGSASGRGAFGGEETLASISEDGSAVAFCTGSVFGDPPGQLTFSCAPYVSRRGASSWSTVSPYPPYCPYDPVGGGAGERAAYASPGSFDRIAFAIPEFESCPLAPLLPGAPLGSYNLYRGDLSGSSHSYARIASDPTASEGTMPGIYGGSSDFSHVLFASRGEQTPDAPAGNFPKLYDWEEDGQGGCTEPEGCLNLVSVRPNSNQPFETGSSFPAYGGVGAESVPVPSGVSTEGNRVYFNNDVGDGSWVANVCHTAACDLYMREGNATTFHVSESECTSACGADVSPGVFLWATPSGDKALFESCAKLSDASNEARICTLGETPGAKDDLKLYRWDRNAPPGHRLVDLTIDEEPSDELDPEAVDVVGASADQSADPESNAAPGNTVYFVAAGQLVSGEPAPTDIGKEPLGLKLYRWRWNGGDPSLDYMGKYLSTRENGALPAGSGPAGSGSLVGDPNADRRHIRVSADGRYLALQTTLPLDPAADRDADADVYRWDEADGWVCASCQLPGVPSAGPASSYTPFVTYNTLFTEFGAAVPEHTISTDGQRLFFATPDALVPEDVNGESGCPSYTPTSGGAGGGNSDGLIYACDDIYEWHDGTLSLLTSGRGSRPFLLIGASGDGKDVFFATGQRMTGWDLDTQNDIYDARAGGGFSEPAPQPPTCEGESCRGAGTLAAVGAGAGTAVFEGPGNPEPKHGNAHRRHHKRHTGRHAKHGAKQRKRSHSRAHARAQRAANHDRRAAR